MLFEVKDFIPSGRSGFRSPEALVEKAKKPVEDIVDFQKAYQTAEGGTALLRTTHNLQSKDVSIGGVIYGVFEAWRNERMVSLSPQHIWYTIVMEVVSTVKDNPDSFRSIFTTSAEGKERILLATDLPDVVDSSKFVELLYERVSSPELVEVIAIDDFEQPLSGHGPEDEVPFSEILATTMLEMASPYFSYETFRCGLKGLELDGPVEDWVKLKSKVVTLQSILGDIQYKRKYELTTMNQSYFPQVTSTLDDIVQVMLKPDDSDTDEFVNSCFHVIGNCGSGHPYLASGWIFDFVSTKILEKSCHPMTYVSWFDVDTNRMFYQVYGCCRGSYDERGVLKMSFSKWVYEVFDRQLFKQIAIIP